MKTKHTPGPWHVQRLGQAGYPHVHGAGDVGQIVTIEASTLWGGKLLPFEENARLIAAAPELLDAAKRALAALRANDAPNCEAAKELTAAITKAEGE